MGVRSFQDEFAGAREYCKHDDDLRAKQDEAGAARCLEAQKARLARGGLKKSGTNSVTTDHSSAESTPLPV